MNEIPDHLQLFDLIRKMLDYDPATRITLGEQFFFVFARDRVVIIAICVEDANSFLYLFRIQIKRCVIRSSKSSRHFSDYTREVMRVPVVPTVIAVCPDEKSCDATC